MLALLSPIIVLAAVIFVHELGHFIAAKLTGVYAPRFSIGFGPSLWKRRRGETEYVLAAFPLGGYVRMASRNDAAASDLEGGSETEGLKEGDEGYDPEAMMPFGPKPVPEHRWFESKSLLARLFIMIAGVAMNIVLAVAIFAGLHFAYGRPVIATRVVGDVRAPLNASALVQLRAGDTIVAVNGQQVATWNDIVERVASAGPGTLSLRTQRGELGIPFGTGNDPKAEDILKAVDYWRPPVLGDLIAGGAAARAGLLKGDTLVSVAGQPVTSFQQMVVVVTASAGKDLAVEVRRAGGAKRLVVRPVASEETDPASGAKRSVGRIGAYPADVAIREPVGPIDALVGGGERTWREVANVVGVVKGLFTAKVSAKELGGPIAIARASVAAGQAGFTGILLLIALLSVNVAVLNLLPIPILDGGQILINIAEAVKGSPFSMRTRENILKAGLVAILMIFAMSTFNDVVRLAKDFGGRLFG